MCVCICVRTLARMCVQLIPHRLKIRTYPAQFANRKSDRKSSNPKTSRSLLIYIDPQETCRFCGRSFFASPSIRNSCEMGCLYVCINACVSVCTHISSHLYLLEIDRKTGTGSFRARVCNCFPISHTNESYHTSD